ncbi:MAG: SPOR domain-containing protein [Gammaproteobacteria bacterium]|nr:SPOR domain-containing protein [Gammaproteobacteria bacterium]
MRAPRRSWKGPVFKTIRAGDADGCVSIGPFRDLSETSQAIASLRAAGHVPEQRLAEGQVWVGHWVFLPAFESRSAARRVLKALKERSVAESYIVPSGDERNAISLGVFAERERALRRAAQITALGYAPKIADRHRSGAVYWVDTEIGPAGQLSADDFEPIPGRILRLEVETCPPSEAQIAASESG